MTPYVVAVIVLTGLCVGLWLYRRGRDRERLKIVEGALEAEQRRKRVDAKVAHMDATQRAGALNRWLRDGTD